MGLGKTEINLRRLLDTAAHQENQAKIRHYVKTLRELLAQLTGESTPEGLPSISTSQAKEYEEKIDALAARLEASERSKVSDSNEIKDVLDEPSRVHIEKQRKLQEDLTNEMDGLAHQLKETSLMMNESLLVTEKILDSTERTVDRSLASINNVNERAGKIYSQSFKASCLSWLAIFIMSCMFLVVVLLIRIT